MSTAANEAEQEVEVEGVGSYDRQQRKLAEQQASATAFTIKAARSVIHEALVRAAAATAKRTTLPIVTCLLIETSGAETGPAMEGAGRVRLTSTDFDQRLETSFGATILGAGAIAIPAKRLLDIVSSLPTAAIVSIEVKGLKARVSAARSKFDVPGFPPGEFPAPPNFKPTIDRFSVEAKAFLSGLARVGPCSSDAESRPTFNSALFEAGDDGLFLVACDGNKLARVRVAESVAFRAQCLIRRGAFSAIRSTFANDETLLITVSGQDFRLEGKESALTTRLVEGPYPDYRMLLRSEPKRTVVVNAELFLAAIKRVGLVADEQRGMIRLIFRAESVRIVAQSADRGRAEDVVECRHLEVTEAAPSQIGMDGRLIATVIDGIGPDDNGEVALQVVGPERPIYVRPAKALDALTVGIAMPLRLIDEVTEDE